MRNIWLILAAVMSTASVLGTPSPAAAQSQTPAVTADDRVLGKPDAPVTIVEYASLTCPHCAAFEAETLPKLKEQWIDTGKAKLVFRDFPFDQAALSGAKLARCAPPDRFFSFIDVLFKDQNNWSRASDPQAALGKIAKLGGISSDQFDACMKDEKLADRIVAGELTAKNNYGVESTPTFFINGKKLVGNQPYPEFEKALNDALPKS
jgi:protein-disulfide isomerase